MTITEAESRILEAARKVFMEDGYVGARMQRIADVAGISKASLHYYFRSKEKLFDRIFDEYMDRIVPLLNTWEDDSDDWETKVRRFVVDLMEVFKDTSILFLVQELRRDPKKLDERLAAKRKKPNRFIHYYERLRASKLVRDQDPRILALAMHSMCAYPLLNAPMMCGALRMAPAEYDTFMTTYAREAADLLVRMMKK
ncbi:MAG: TetR/AcrR family transcriptional regulator [Bacteroidetes bacterium]|nr:TetR/AcrR family transcriptional regulator [Bacteroidota bacterium]